MFLISLFYTERINRHKRHYWSMHPESIWRGVKTPSKHTMLDRLCRTLQSCNIGIGIGLVVTSVNFRDCIKYTLYTLNECPYVHLLQKATFAAQTKHCYIRLHTRETVPGAFHCSGSQEHTYQSQSQFLTIWYTELIEHSCSNSHSKYA